MAVIGCRLRWRIVATNQSAPDMKPVAEKTQDKPAGPFRDDVGVRSGGHGIAELERDLIRERTGEGRKRAQAAGVKFGRKPKLSAYQRQEAINAAPLAKPLPRSPRALLSTFR
jgi:hypothetical protein